jgi:hypothetical protein
MTVVLQGKEAKEACGYMFVEEAIDNLIAIEKIFKDTDRPDLATRVRKALYLLIPKLYPQDDKLTKKVE